MKSIKKFFDPQIRRGLVGAFVMALLAMAVDELAYSNAVAFWIGMISGGAFAIIVFRD